MAKTSKGQQRRFFNSADEHQKAIVQILRDVSRAHGLDRTWADWTEMSALALANAVDRAQFERRERRYLEIVGHYDKEDLQQLVEAFAHLVQCWEQRVAADEFGDVLGSTFMMLDMGNSGTGQFFTPYEVSRLMGNMMMGNSQDLVEKTSVHGFVRVLEPACGGGGMLIAAAHAMHDAQLNYQQCMHATAIDIDQRCVHMTFIQLALLHVPAVVIHGNGLTGECREQWFTPAHILGGWGARLRHREAQEGARAVLEAPAAVPDHHVDHVAADGPSAEIESPLQGIPTTIRKVAAAGQMSLF